MSTYTMIQTHYDLACVCNKHDLLACFVSECFAMAFEKAFELPTFSLDIYIYT